MAPTSNARREGVRSFFDLTGEPAIRVRLVKGLSIARTEDGASLALAYEGDPGPGFTPWAAEFESANKALEVGAPLAELRNLVLEVADPGRASFYLFLLQKLFRQGWVELALFDEGDEAAVVHALWEDFVPAFPPLPAAGDSLHRFVVLRRDLGAWLVESPLAGARVRVSDLAALDRPLVRRALAGAGFLESSETQRPPSQREALVQWEYHDLLFHVHSRQGWHHDALGATFPYIGEIEPLPAVRPGWPGERIPLARAPEGAGGEAFASILERRRSERAYDESRPISLADLGRLLDRAVAVRSRSTGMAQNLWGRQAPFETSRRPYPNGGASYELETYLVVDRSADLPSGAYHYDAGEHALVRICGRTDEVEEILQQAFIATVGQAKPQVVLVLAARFARVMWKYRAISYSVILRNVGALYQTLYLAATEFGLSPCGIGSGSSLTFAKLTGLDPWVEGSVGEFILGGPPSRD